MLWEAALKGVLQETTTLLLLPGRWWEASPAFRKVQATHTHGLLTPLLCFAQVLLCFAKPLWQLCRSAGGDGPRVSGSCQERCSMWAV